MQCGVCGGVRFTGRAVLWDELVDDWQLSPIERGYIDRQQGECCADCGSNLRSIALANGIRAHFATASNLKEFACSPRAEELAVLEINEAGSLTGYLRCFGRHVLGSYPELDMHALPYADAAFNMVVHSDTLEHVVNPVHALAECRRVLMPGGALCFTVPIIVGRMSLDRTGLRKSYHGCSTVTAEDLVVQTEFGADAWTYLMEAGFDDIAIHAVEYPAATALVARTGWPVCPGRAR